MKLEFAWELTLEFAFVFQQELDAFLSSQKVEELVDFAESASLVEEKYQLAVKVFAPW